MCGWSPLRLGSLGEWLAQLRFMQRSGESLLQRLIALLALKLNRLIEQIPATEMVKHEVEQVDVLHAHPMLLLGDVIQKREQEVAHPKLVFRRVVEDIESDLVADARTTQELVRSNPR